jgi:hypothetical protein
LLLFLQTQFAKGNKFLCYGKIVDNYISVIHFGYQIFRWINEIAGKATVYVVIISFKNFELKINYNLNMIH